MNFTTSDKCARCDYMALGCTNPEQCGAVLDDQNPLEGENEELRDRLDHVEHAWRYLVDERNALRKYVNAEYNTLRELEHECRLEYHPESMATESDKRIVGLLCKLDAIRRKVS